MSRPRFRIALDTAGEVAWFVTFLESSEELALIRLPLRRRVGARHIAHVGQHVHGLAVLPLHLTQTTRGIAFSNALSPFANWITRIASSYRNFDAAAAAVQGPRLCSKVDEHLSQRKPTSQNRLSHSFCLLSSLPATLYVLHGAVAQRWARARRRVTNLNQCDCCAFTPLRGCMKSVWAMISWIGKSDEHRGAMQNGP